MQLESEEEQFNLVSKLACSTLLGSIGFGAVACFGSLFDTSQKFIIGSLSVSFALLGLSAGIVIWDTHYKQKFNEASIRERLYQHFTSAVSYTSTWAAVASLSYLTSMVALSGEEDCSKALKDDYSKALMSVFIATGVMFISSELRGKANNQAQIKSDNSLKEVKEEKYGKYNQEAYKYGVLNRF